jgi:hypothetical protein
MVQGKQQINMIISCVLVSLTPLYIFFHFRDFKKISPAPLQGSDCAGCVGSQISHTLITQKPVSGHRQGPQMLTPGPTC